ncbi:HprK-related kinase B [Halomonas halmophila]|uniref:HPr kinase n=1 Tax=Halomonas halmophila TaxID=252 RepID=A0A4Y4F5U3_9GAMM|nr:HprK-related kinase B [Halomonas halmophila]GED23234.1 hypothetical protein HHA01_22110 [Halomonas halmophila]
MSVPNACPAGYAEILRGEARLLEAPLVLAMGDCSLRLRSNSPAMLERLGEYFAHCRCDAAEAPPECLDLEIIEGAPPALAVDFIDWSREPGKQGRKDSYHDLPGGRLVRKVRTGLVFLQSADQRMAAGPCLAHDNQVINFILAQTMNHLQQRGWQVCHAAALVGAGGAVAIAGFSGGGKSTAMLHAMDIPGARFLTNDRLFLKRQGEALQAAGVPKQPRINPGTALHNPRLVELLPEARRAALRTLSSAELWSLEEKYDVPVSDIYGPERSVSRAPLGALVILDWQRDAAQPLTMRRIDPRQHPELLAAVMKSPGPFYQAPDGSFQADGETLNAEPYQDLLATTPVYAVRGGVDFAALVEDHLKPLMERPA